MLNDDFCSYELSKKLKEKGFYWPCDAFYDCHFNFKEYAKTDVINRNTNGHHTPSCSAPTLSQAAKWLREEKGIVVTIDPETSYIDDGLAGRRIVPKYYYCHWRVRNGVDVWNQEDCNNLYDTYEQALSAGITKALELI